MMLESLPSLTPDIYYETEVDVIIPTDEKMKLKVTENISGRLFIICILPLTITVPAVSKNSEEFQNDQPHQIFPQLLQLFPSGVLQDDQVALQPH